MSVLFQDANLLPGPQAAREAAESEFLWNKGGAALFSFGDVVDGSARDTGNTGATTTLRSGLLMGKITSTGLLKQYDPTATDGTEVVYGPNAVPTKVTDPDGNNVNKTMAVVIAGPVKASKLFISTSPFTIDQQARSQMRGRFIFDDDIIGNIAYPWKRQQTKIAAYPVVAADNGSLFDNTGAVGAVTFTLPAIANGLAFGFLVVADQTITVASAEGDNVVTFNDASADSVAFSTVGEKIGGIFHVYSNDLGTKWIVEKPCQNTMTVAT